MGKGETISTRWAKWAEKDGLWKGEFWWAYSALTTMAISFIGLILHLGILHGFWRTYFLVQMITGGVVTEAIMVYRKQWWWAGYWGICVLLGVSVTEIASYLCSKLWGF